MQISAPNIEETKTKQKIALDAAKDSLSIPNFRQLKRNDPWEKAIDQLGKQITKKFSAQHVTKGWLKMYEMLTLTPVGSYLLSILGTVNVFYNAALPGAFIFADNHYFRTNNKNINWVVSSYYPKDTEGKDFLGDKYGLLTKYPERSLVGAITTSKGRFWSDGDLTNAKVPAILAMLAKSKLGTINMYTADGAFDVEGKENLQEELSMPLIRGEIECGFRSLSVGGVMIIKIFTFFTPQMWTLLVYLTRLFEKFDIYKPQTSGVLNSESYFIGIGYKGTNDFSIIMKDSRDPTTRYSEPTEAENIFLFNKMMTLTTNQINNINNFLQGHGPKLSVNLDIKPLPTKDQL